MKKVSDTFAVCITLDRKDVIECFSNKDLHKIYELAKATDSTGIVVGGQLHMKDRGCFGVAFKDTSDIEPLVKMVNNRMADLGSGATSWVICSTDKEIQKRAERAIAKVAGFVGGMQ